MRRRSLLPAFGLGAVAVLAALAVVLASWQLSADGSSPARRPLPAGIEALEAEGEPSANALRRGIEARASLAPGTGLFGDTFAASVDVVLDRRRIDPDSVRLAADFVPWEIVGDPVRARRDSGDTTHLRTTYTVRCLSGACVPLSDAISVEFPPVSVTFSRRSTSGAAGEALEVEWPRLFVYSRTALAALEARGSTIPWRADLVSQPDVSYRVSPTLAIALATAGSALFAVAALALLAFAWWRRAPAPAPEPELPPEPELTPLEQALALLEDTARVDGFADRRRALELVAEELAIRDADLAEAARTLAWSEDVPKADATSELATRVRSLIGELEKDETEGSEEKGEGRVV
jgi:hypothetical protein